PAVSCFYPAKSQVAMTMIDPDEFNLIERGPSYHLSRRLGLARPSAAGLLSKTLLLVLVAWVPLPLLSILAGIAAGRAADVPLLHDPVVYSRFLFVVPLLAIADIVVKVGLAVQARHFPESGIVSEEETIGFKAAKAETLRLRESAVAEGVILVLALS